MENRSLIHEKLTLSLDIMSMKFKHNSISEFTTFKIGGPANHFAVCDTIEELQKAVASSQFQGLPWFVLGNGSNILVSDDGFPGQVIKLSGDFQGVVFGQDSVQVGAGVILPGLSSCGLAKGWGGFEFMCGIPGTIGGAVRINAGTKQGEIKDHIISATVLTPAGEIKTLNKQELGFSYRHSKLVETSDIVLSATFAKPYVTDKAVIQEKIKEIIACRRQKQPRIKRNCGSVFKSPPGGKPAGWYIDQVGLKGFRIGDAMIAHEHANWIVNLGNARAVDVKAIISLVQETVFQKFGVMLEREVIYVPEDIL